MFSPTFDIWNIPFLNLTSNAQFYIKIRLMNLTKVDETWQRHDHRHQAFATWPRGWWPIITQLLVLRHAQIFGPSDCAPLLNVDPNFRCNPFFVVVALRASRSIPATTTAASNSLLILMTTSIISGATIDSDSAGRPLLNYLPSKSSNERNTHVKNQKF